jgi:predicted DNA-binding transcriptional regulator YafY
VSYNSALNGTGTVPESETILGHTQGETMARKIDRDSTSSMKALTLYSLLLFSGKHYSLSELAKRLECSKPTVLRLIDAIDAGNGLHVRVETEKVGKQSFYWATRPESRPNVALDAKSIQDLVLCRDMLWNLMPTALREEIGATIERTTVLLGNFDERESALRSVAEPAAKGMVDYSAHQGVLATVLEALHKGRILDLVYRAHDKPTGKPMSVAPLRLVTHRESLYLLARREQDLKKKKDFFEPRLALQRIDSAELTDRTFAPPATKPDQGGHFGFMPGEPFKVVVEAEARVAPYIRERIWSGDQKISELEGGRLMLVFSATSENEVASWVLGFAGDVELITPAKLRREIGVRAEKMADTHR